MKKLKVEKFLAWKLGCFQRYLYENWKLISKQEKIVKFLFWNDFIDAVILDFSTLGWIKNWSIVKKSPLITAKYHFYKICLKTKNSTIKKSNFKFFKINFKLKYQIKALKVWELNQFCWQSSITTTFLN
jgi:hypothetical protein